MPVQANRATEASGVLVNIEILGQPYKVRSNLETNYVAELATYVDQKMQTASEKTAGADSLRIAILAALNIADEYFRYHQARTEPDGAVQQLTIELEELIDQALSEK